MKMEWKKVSQMNKEDADEMNRPGYEINKPTLSEDLLVIVGAISQQGNKYIINS